MNVFYSEWPLPGVVSGLCGMETTVELPGIVSL